MTALINDNNPVGPLRRIVDAHSMPKGIIDSEPYQEKLILECGHWLYNTYGDKHPMYKVNDFIKCKICGSKS